MTQSVSSANPTAWPLEVQGGFLFLAFCLCILVIVVVGLALWSQLGGCGASDWCCCLLFRYCWRKWCRCPATWHKQLRQTLRDSGDELSNDHT